MILRHLTSKSDLIGATASSLCLIHCIATPLIFVVQAEMLVSKETHAHPEWWGLLDFFFLLISLFAVIWTSRTTSKRWISHVLWISWFGLLFFVINEKLSLVHLAEELVYLPALSLVFFHLYNRKYCNCD